MKQSAAEQSVGRKENYRLLKESRDDPSVLVVAALEGNGRQRKYLRRRVFGPLHGASPAFDAIYVGLTLLDKGRRVRHLERVRDAIASGDDETLVKLAQSETWWSLPTGYELVRPFIGAGKTSRVALVARSEDGAQYAWKIPENDGEGAGRELREVAARSEEWVRLGAALEPVRMVEDGRTALQPYVEGVTLHKLLRKWLSTSSDRSSVGNSAVGSGAELLRVARRTTGQEMLAGGFAAIGSEAGESLIDLYVRLAQGHAFVSGLNPRNLIHDGDRWQVIDSGSVQRASGVVEAFSLQRRSAHDQWTRWTPDAGAVAEAVFRQVREKLRLGWSSPIRAAMTRASRVVLRRRRGRI